MHPLRLPFTESKSALPGRRAGFGFTLIELLIAVAVLAIVMTLGAPSFADFIRSNRLKSAAFDLVVSLNYTRSEAIKRNADAALTPAAGGWDAGWSVQSGGDTLKVFEAPAGIEINPVADGVAWTDPVTFNRSGRPSGFRSMLFTVRLSDAGDNRFIRCVQVDFGGTAAIGSDANGDGDCANG